MGNFGFLRVMRIPFFTFFVDFFYRFSRFLKEILISLFQLVSALGAPKILHTSHVVGGNSMVSAQANKTSHAGGSSAHIPGKESVTYRGQLIDVLATKANATACAPTSNKCLLCARKFISKHALRIHLTRNAKCRRQVSSRATWH